MTIQTHWGRAILAAGIGLSMLGGMGVSTAHAQEARKGRQADKNNMRNLGIGLGAAAAYEAINKRNGSALVLGAGALLSAKKYEDARKAQNRDNSGSAARREYRYENGQRIGYYARRNGKKLAYYKRLRDDDGDYTNRYKAVKWY